MSEVVGWTIIAIIVAVSLSWGLTLWRARQSPATRKDRVAAFPRQHSLLLSMLAIALAGLAQIALQAEQPGFVALGYGFAVFLFVSALYPLIPITVMVEPSHLTARASATLTQSQPGSARPRSVFLRTWRYSALDNILKGRPSAIPNSAASEPPIASATVESFAASQPAAVRVWAGFDRPQSLCVTSQGNIFVLDDVPQRVYCLNPQGQIIRAWSLPEIPDLQECRIAMSPDGRNLYLADPARGQVYCITLHEDQL